MKKLVIVLALAVLLSAGRVDIRVVTSSTPDNSLAYAAISGLIHNLENQNATWNQIITKPPQVGLTLTAVPNPKNYTGILLVFDQNATTGDPVQDKKIADSYVYDVILPAIKSGMRVAIVVSPHLTNKLNDGDYIGQAVLARLGLILAGKNCCTAREIEVNSNLHPIYNGISSLPGRCCIIPIVPDVVAPASLGKDGKYCVVIRVTKWGDEMIIMGWKGILVNITSDSQTQQLMKNVLLYLAKELPAKYPKIKTVYKTVTTTVVNNVTTTETVTSTVTQTQTVTTTLYSTVTTTVTQTLTKTVTETVSTTKLIVQTIISTVTNTVTTTLYSTVTTTVFQTLTSTVTTTLTTTYNITSTVTTTLTKTLFNTVTTTVTKEVTNYVFTAAAFIIGLIIAFAASAALSRGGGGKSESTSIEW